MITCMRGEKNSTSGQRLTPPTESLSPSTTRQCSSFASSDARSPFGRLRGSDAVLDSVKIIQWQPSAARGIGRKCCSSQVHCAHSPLFTQTNHLSPAIVGAKNTRRLRHSCRMNVLVYKNRTDLACDHHSNSQSNPKNKQRIKSVQT